MAAAQRRKAVFARIDDSLDVESIPVTDLLNSSMLSYPLTLRFKLVAISNQFELRDGQDQLLGYVRQPWAKIREAVSVFSDAQQSQLLYTIKADRMRLRTHKAWNLEN
jgi:hypothetical protein